MYNKEKNAKDPLNITCQHMTPTTKFYFIGFFTTNTKHWTNKQWHGSRVVVQKKENRNT